MEIVTVIIALWGAVLSTILAVREYRKDRPKLRIEISLINDNLFWVMSDPDGKESELPKYAVVTLSNIGYRSLNIKSVNLIMREGIVIKSGKLIADKLPKILEVPETVEIYFPVEDIFSSLTSGKDYLKSVQVVSAAGTIRKASVPKAITTEILKNT